MIKKIAITTGDPAGIGPEITTSALQFFDLKKEIAYIIYGKSNFTTSYNKPIKINEITEAKEGGKLYHISINSECKLGEVSKEAGEISLNILKRVSIDLNSKELEAVVTNPISKQAIRLSDKNFIGHTEFFAESSKTKDAVMTFWGPSFNLALLTTHTPLHLISDILTENYIKNKINVIISSFSKFIPNCKFAILGVNPHAGENGAFGNIDEKIKTILKEFKNKDITIDGPFPADTFFTQKPKYDVIISAYHDQGLIPFKMISFEQGVNVTLGLPYIRTSVDHGTAFDIAGKNIASDKSLISAIQQAEKMLFIKNNITHLPYSYFAKFYDTYMEHVEYDKWIDFILEKFNKLNKKSPDNILELACGTGNISQRLIKKGLKVDACDLTPEMIKIANSKKYKPNLFQANMLSPIDKSYDLILILFDSLNYLSTYEEMTLTLKNCYNSLTDDGVLIFDISTTKNCEEYFYGFINIEENEDTFIIHTAEYYPNKEIQENNFEFFEKIGYLYRRKNELHQQTIFKSEKIISIIKKSDFDLKGIYSMDSKQNLKTKKGFFLDKNFTRLFFILKKN